MAKKTKKASAHAIPVELARLIEDFSKEGLATIVAKAIARGVDTNLHNVWKLLGAPSGKDPVAWLAGDGRDFSEYVVGHVGLGDRDKVIRTVDGEIRAHWKIAMAYAEYLDPLIMLKAMDLVAERHPKLKEGESLTDRLLKMRAS